MIIETNFFDEPAYSTEYPKDFAVVESDIMILHSDRYSIVEPVKDVRFSDKAWNRIHASALESLVLWTIKPTDSKLEQTLRKWVFIAVSPSAVIFDVIVNTALSVPKLAVVGTSYIASGIQSVVLWKESSIDVFGMIKDRNTDLFFRSVVRSYLNIGQNILDIFFSIVQTVVDVGPTLESKYEWSYWIYPMSIPKNQNYYTERNSLSIQEAELVLDQNKVKFLRESCGWSEVDDKKLLSCHEPYDEYDLIESSLGKDRMRLTYAHGKEAPLIRSQWTEWDVVEVVGNTKYYAPRVCSASSKRG
jgi:hypothetical protein